MWHAADEALTRSVIRTCACGVSFVKENGCNHVPCVCGRHMCYLCRACIGPEYDHFCQCADDGTDACPRCHLYQPGGDFRSLCTSQYAKPATAPSNTATATTMPAIAPADNFPGATGAAGADELPPG